MNPQSWRPGNPQPWRPGNVGDRNTSIASMEGQLLSSILGLMRPMIAAHMSMSDEHIETYFTNVAAGDEGNKLIFALKNFMTAGVLAAIQHADGASGMPSPEKTDKNTSNGTESVGKASNVKSKKSGHVIQAQIPSEVQPTELESMIQRQTRAHVFNNMPIRMLEFDSNGSNIKLIGRDDIFRILILRVQEKINSPKFQQDWNKALGFKDVSFSFMYRSNRMIELVTDVVSGISPYAILSHTWIRESPGDVIFNTWNNCSSNYFGWKKIENFCRVAAHDHKMTLGWVDSVCIDKGSSSELDESIRSMYKWYRGSQICITYLSNTQALGDGAHESWFTRGWTLQELLAPKNTAFYNQHWKPLGTDRDSAIQSLVTAETTITTNEMELCRSGKVKDIAIGRIFQMASRRQVTREEDSAYSLLGLLDVNMLIAYGEGESLAFRRLCQELLASRKHVFDLFIRQYQLGDGLIPPSLKRYSARTSRFDEIMFSMPLDDYHSPEPIVQTHLGIRCQLLLFPALGVEKGSSDEKFFPKGHYSGQYGNNIRTRGGALLFCVFNLLDKRIYGNNSESIHPLRGVLDVVSRRPTVAVLTFSLKGGAVLVPKFVMGILVHTPDKPGTVHTGSKIHILPQTMPVVFTITNITGGPRKIPIQDLERHGIQLVTLYL